MNPKIDLRRYNITDEDSALEFIELIVTKLPQIQKVMKARKLKIQSLQNHLDASNAKNTARESAIIGDVNTNVSVADRLSGKTLQPSTVKQASRIEQMRGAQSTPQASSSQEMPDLPEITTNPNLLPPAPVDPGQIGNLNLPMPTGNAHPDAADKSDVIPDDGTPEGEPSTDDIELDTPEPEQDLEDTSKPSEEDITPVGTTVAKAQAKKK